MKLYLTLQSRRTRLLYLSPTSKIIKAETPAAIQLKLVELLWETKKLELPDTIVGYFTASPSSEQPPTPSSNQQSNQSTKPNQLQSNPQLLPSQQALIRETKKIEVVVTSATHSFSTTNLDLLWILGNSKFQVKTKKATYGL
jgi:hypothetical protein